MSEKHCADCCCDQSWKALGITEYTGKSIPEHITTLTEERDRLRELALPFAQCWCGEENQPCNCNNCRLRAALTTQESDNG